MYKLPYQCASISSILLNTFLFLEFYHLTFQKFSHSSYIFQKSCEIPPALSTPYLWSLSCWMSQRIFIWSIRHVLVCIRIISKLYTYPYPMLHLWFFWVYVLFKLSLMVFIINTNCLGLIENESWNFLFNATVTGD